MTIDAVQLISRLMCATVFLTVAWLTVRILLWLTDVQSPKCQATAWLLVLIQALMFVPGGLGIPVAIPVMDDLTSTVERVIATPLAATTDAALTAGREQVSGGTERSAVHTGTRHAEQTSTRNSVAPDNLPSSGVPDRQAVTARQLPLIPVPRIAAGIALVWVSGLCVCWCRMLTGYLWFLRRLPAARICPESWTKAWQSVQQTVARGSSSAARRFVPLYVTDSFGPAVFWMPGGCRLLIPARAWQNLSESQQDSILRHEWSHLCRGDLWRAAVCRVIASLQWFNPLAWMVIRRLDECAEWACDDHAVGSDAGKCADYVRALLDLSLTAQAAGVALPSAVGHSLIRRSQRILSPVSRKDSTMLKIGLTLSLSLLLAVHVAASSAVDTSNSTATEPASAVTVTGSRQDPGPPATEFPAHVLPGTLTTPVLLVGDQGAIQITSMDEFVPPLVNSVLPAAGLNPQPAEHGITEAVIDLTYVFRNDPEFERARLEMQKKVAELDSQLRARADNLLKLKSTMEATIIATGNRSEQQRQEIDKLLAEVEVDARLMKDRLRVMESEVYLTTYRRVRRVIADYARENGIQIVRRASSDREQERMLNSGEPGTILQALQADIVYLADDRMDITDEVLMRLKAETATATTTQTPALPDPAQTTPAEPAVTPPATTTPAAPETPAGTEN